MRRKYAKDDAMLTEVFRKHMGHCPIADAAEMPSRDIGNEASEERQILAEFRRDAVELLRGYRVPVSAIAQVLGLSTSSVYNYTRSTR